MPITLAQAQINTQSDVDYAVIDNLRRHSWLFDQMVFDDTATPGTGGASLNYAYTRLVTPAAAGFRAFNTEYTPGQATRQRYSVDLKPMGGSFTVDRVFANLGDRRTAEVVFQMQQLLTSAIVRWQQEVILGDTAVDANGFDGLDKILTGTSTELTTATNWTPGSITSQALAMAELDKLDEWLSRIVPSHTGSGDLSAPGALPAGVKAIMGNTKSTTRLRALARWAGMFTESKDDLGRKIQMYGDWFIVDIGDRADGSTPIIPIASNATAMYAATFGLDAFHAASPANAPLVLANLPEFTTTGAVKAGEVEIGPSAVVLKNTKAAGVYRNITVQ